MLSTEPVLRVGILDGCAGVAGEFLGEFHLPGGGRCAGAFEARISGREISVESSGGLVIARGSDLSFLPAPGAAFLLKGVTIGVKFHWERREDQRFEGSLRLLLRPGGEIVAINEVPLETYLQSVISSEMSADAPVEFLKAHAITSRSWLGAMLARLERRMPALAQPPPTSAEIIRWYAREDHDLYDVCADDHCQRYQGTTKVTGGAAQRAVRETRGLFLTSGNEICDARYHKACGGLTDEFQNAWEQKRVPYLRCVSDAAVQHPPLANEQDAERWILSRPDAYCNVTDPESLRAILPAFDRETADFFRWTVAYQREELERILREKSGIDIGTLLELLPLERGPSGRLVRLRIRGTAGEIVVGKELEIRRWLSPSHLYSSAFVVRIERDASGIPTTVRLHGAGWGHGVGLCQIGAAQMVRCGSNAEQTVLHYFPGATLTRLY